MSDTFHADVPDAFLVAMFTMFNAHPRHVYQVLTKRPGRAHAFFQRHPELLSAGVLAPHIWLGTSVAHAATLFRVEHLRQIPAATRFLSCEPLLGPLRRWRSLRGIQWVIDGGESGRNARPTHPAWFRGIRDTCAASGVPYLHKQNGAFAVVDTADPRAPIRRTSSSTMISPGR